MDYDLRLQQVRAEAKMMQDLAKFDAKVRDMSCLFIFIIIPYTRNFGKRDHLLQQIGKKDHM
jgi:hypothetical protein